jgi:hypothetical protein
VSRYVKIPYQTARVVLKWSFEPHLFLTAGLIQDLMLS